MARPTTTNPATGNPAEPAISGLRRPDANTRILAGFRIMVGALWLSNVGWKEPPDFGALRAFTSNAVSNPVFPPYSALVDNIILPHFTMFAWGTLILEGVVGACLLMGLFTRLFALVGAGMATAIALSVLKTPNEWPWAYYLMIGSHLAIFAAAAGRTWGLDGLLRTVLLDRPGRLVGLLAKAT